MDPNILKKIYKDSKAVSDTMGSISSSTEELVEHSEKEEKREEKAIREEEKKENRLAQMLKRKEKEQKTKDKKKKAEEKKEKKNGLAEMLKGLSGFLMPALTAALASIGPAIAAAIGGLGLAAAIGGLLVAFGPQIWDAMKGGLQTMWDKMKSGFSSMWDEIRGWMSGAEEKLNKKVNEVTINAKKLFGITSSEEAEGVRNRGAHIRQHNMNPFYNSQEQREFGAKLLKINTELYNQLQEKNELEAKRLKLEERLARGMTARERQEYARRGEGKEEWEDKLGAQIAELDSSVKDTEKTIQRTKQRFAAVETTRPGGAVRRQNGGTVQTILEPGEKVFLPGQWGSDIHQLNSAIPRFQNGGGVGPKEIIAAAEQNIGLSKGVGEQCANTTRAVLKAAGHEQADKATQKGDLDPDGTAYNGPGFAASFAGSDMGTVKKDFSQVAPGDVMLWKDTYGNFTPGAITHVGIAGEGNVQYDHSRSAGWERTNRESGNFAAAITLNGSGGGSGSGTGEGVRGGTDLGNKPSGIASGIFDLLGRVGIDAKNSPLGGLIGFMEGFGTGIMDAFSSLGGDVFGDLWGGVTNIGAGLGGAVMGATGLDAPSNVDISSAASAGDATDKKVLDIIASVEADQADPYGGFNTSAGGTAGRATEKTIGWLAQNAKGAIGRYQHMPRFLLERAQQAGYNANTKFTPDVQDRLTLDFLKRDTRGMYDKWKNSGTNPEGLADEMSRIWRGLPHSSGGTYPDQYAAGNAAHMSRSQLMQELKSARLKPQGLQSGGTVGSLVNLSGAASALAGRMHEANADFINMKAESITVEPLVVFEDAPKPTVTTTPTPTQTVPRLPDGPDTTQAAEYSYHLSLGGID